MAKKFKLDLEFEIEGTLLAIVSNWPDYKIAWKISKILDLELVKQHDWNVFYKDDKKNSFLLYLFTNEYTTFRLLRNKAYQIDNESQAFLLPEIKEFDYLLMINSEADLDFLDIIEKIKRIESIQLVKSFNPDTLKSKHNIAF